MSDDMHGWIVRSKTGCGKRRYLLGSRGSRWGPRFSYTHPEVYYSEKAARRQLRFSFRTKKARANYAVVRVQLIEVGGEQ